jgi:thiamine-monophosphate kinase
VPTLREVGELEAIRRLITAREPAADAARAATAESRAGIRIGPGDDAAVLSPSPGADLVATTDAFVENRHYLADWLTPREVGARLAAACVSDLAAMGARPRWALHSLGARPDHDVDALVELQRGIEAFLAGDGATIVGGNIVAAGGLEWMSLTLLGEVGDGRGWTRSGARRGDWIAVTGWPGRAGAGMGLARKLGEEARRPGWQPLLDAWIRPRSRVALAGALAATDAVHAAIDVSDGFAGDLLQLCKASGVGAELEADSLADPLLEAAARALGTSAERLVFGPSDDYELVLAVDPSGREACEQVARDALTRLTFVGRFSGDRAELVRRTPDGARQAFVTAGWDHFSAER